MNKTIMTRRRLLRVLSTLSASLSLRGWSLPLGDIRGFTFVFLVTFISIDSPITIRSI